MEHKMKKIVFVGFSVCIFFFAPAVSTVRAQTKTIKGFEVLGCLQSISTNRGEIELQRTYSDNGDEFDPVIYNSELKKFNKEFAVTSEIYFYDDDKKGEALAVTDVTKKKDGLCINWKTSLCQNI